MNGWGEVPMLRNTGKPIVLTFCVMLFLSAFCSASACADTVVKKIYAGINYEPVAMMQTDLIHVSSMNDEIVLTDMYWQDAATGTRLQGEFSTVDVQLFLTFASRDGCVFADNTEATVNTATAECQVSESRRYAVVIKKYKPLIWRPAIMKQPTDEYPNENGMSAFSASAEYAVRAEWYACDAETGKTLKIPDMNSSISISFDGYTSKLAILSTPLWMDGKQIYCKFYGLYNCECDSNKASIHVKAAPQIQEPLTAQDSAVYAGAVPEQAAGTSESPASASSPEPTAPPDAEGGSDAEETASPEMAEDPGMPEETPAGTPGPEETAAVPEEGEEAADKASRTEADGGETAVHVHEYAAEWSYDETAHWHECSCGARSDESGHTMVWETVTERGLETEHGVCSGCGMEITRIPEKTEASAREKNRARIMVILGAVCLLSFVIYVKRLAGRKS